MQAKALIHLDHLKTNIDYIKQLYKKSEVAFVIKANAYGHGLENITPTLQASYPEKSLLVCELEKAITLRQQYPRSHIVFLHGFINQEELTKVIKHNIACVIHHPNQIKNLKSYSFDKVDNLEIWLKVNTGMNRLGLDQETMLSVEKKLKQIPQCLVKVLMTHLACADQKEHHLNQTQLKNFETIKTNISKKSVANSAVICNSLDKDDEQRLIRPGLMLYGISPLKKQLPELKPVMTLKAPIISIYNVAKNNSVGYGGTWKAKRPSKIAVLKVGYGDGYPRLLGNQSRVFFEGFFYPVIGNVSMDMISIDISDQPKESQLKLGDFVEIWGSHVKVEDLAQIAKTIPYELLTNLNQRVERVTI